MQSFALADDFFAPRKSLLQWNLSAPAGDFFAPRCHNLFPSLLEIFIDYLVLY